MADQIPVSLAARGRTLQGRAQGSSGCRREERSGHRGLQPRPQAPLFHRDQSLQPDPPCARRVTAASGHLPRCHSDGRASGSAWRLASGPLALGTRPCRLLPRVAGILLREIILTLCRSVSVIELPVLRWSSPHFSPVVCCSAGYIRHNCVALGRAPRRTVKYAGGPLPARALSWLRLRRFATTTGEKCGLGACRELAPSKQESTTYEPSLVCKLLILSCRLLIPDRLLERFVEEGQKLLQPSDRWQSL